MATASTAIRPPASLPRAIRRGLAGVDRRLRAIGAAKGLGIVTLVMAVGAASGMGADVAFVLGRTARWALWGAWIAAGSAAMLTTVVRPIARKLTWADLAAVAESDQPTLGERITSAVALLGGRPHGSPDLIAALAEDAAERARQADLTRAISARGAVAMLALGLAATTAVVTPAVARPDPFGRMARRFLMPWADIERVGRFTVEVSPGDRVVAIGSDLPVSATVRPRFGERIPTDDAYLERTDAAGTGSRVKMVADPDQKPNLRKFAVLLPNLDGSLTYRVATGSAASRTHRIIAVEAPATANLKVDIAPPAYTRRPDGPARDPARVEAWEDSRIVLELISNKPARQVEVIWPKEGPASKAAEDGPSRIVELKPSPDGRRWRATVAAEASGPFSFKLRDEHALENRPEPPRRLTVRPDAPPALAVVAPDGLKESKADDLLLMGVVAHDDVAVTSCEVHYTIDRARGSAGPLSGHVNAPIPGLGTRAARGEAALSLKPLALRPGDAVSYRIRVADNRPAPRGPNVAWSGPHGLRIVEHSESLMARQGAADRGELRDRLEAIKKATVANLQGAERIRRAAESARHGQGAWDEGKARALVDREGATQSVSDQLRLLARDFDDHPTFRPLARPSRQVAAVENEAARAVVEAARRADDATKRLAELQKTDGRFQAVIAKLDELLRKFDELARHDDDRHRLRALAERQEDLAARAEEASKDGDRARVDGLRDEQERLRHELDDLLRHAPALRAEALAAQAREADDLAARARALADSQRDESRLTADQARQRPALRALAERQRAVEDDARRLALRVDSPLAENWRPRVDADAAARAIDPIQRGDLDQARDRAREAEHALNRLARDLEDVRDDPKALAHRLVRRQEALRSDVAEAVREAREHPPQTPEGKAALAGRLEPLADRQEAIARLAATIPAPREHQDAARNAARATAKALDDLRGPNPREAEPHQGEARDALNRLADALPDEHQLRERARQKLAEAKNKAGEVARELENALRETAPGPGQPHDPAKASAELARRVAPLIPRQREAVASLAAVEPEPRALPQRDRASRRAEALADALQAVASKAPPQPAPGEKPDEARPIASWRVLGAFPIASPAPDPADKPPDPAARYPDRKGQPASWKDAAPVDDRGTIDLGQIYSEDADQAAFGYAEVPSPTARRAQLAIRSDDTMTLWLNGKAVYDFQGNRGLPSEPDRVDVTLAAGVNRIRIKCGNLASKWQFSVGVTPPVELFRPVADWRVLGAFPIGDPAPVPTDGPIDPKVQAKDRKGRPASWKDARPVNDRGAIDLAALYETQDPNVAAFGYAEVESPAPRLATMLIGSNDTMTLWLDGKAVYDSQVGRGWAPDHARVEVTLAAGVNRIWVKCGNLGGPWMFSIALSEPPPIAPESSPRPDDRPIARRDEPADPGPLREALTARQTDAQAALERLEQKLHGQAPADDLAAELADDQRDAKAEPARPLSDDPAARAERAADQRRVANAVRGLDAPDAPLAQAEAARRAEAAAKALDDPAGDPEAVRRAVAEAAAASEALARRLADEPSPAEDAEALARAQRELNGPEAPADPAAQARREHAIAEDLARLSVRGKADAVEAVARAAELADRAARQDAAARPDPAALSQARDRAAEALDDLAARQAAPPPNASPRDRAEALARAERALAGKLREAARHEAKTAADPGQAPPAEARGRLASELAPLAARQQALAEAARALPEPAGPRPGPARPGDTGPHEGRPRAEAEAAQRRAAEAMARADPADAADAAGDAAEALDRLAQALPGEAPGPDGRPAQPIARGEHPGRGERQAQGEQDGPGPGRGPAKAGAPEDPELGLKPADVAEAADLARRERRIREGLQAILGERVPPQRDLKNRASALGRELADLRERSREIGPRAQGPAHAAAELMGQAAPHAMEHAAEALNQARPGEALGAQRQAADLVEQAARHVEDLAAALRDDRPADAPEPTGRDLADARAGQVRAGQALSQARDPSQGVEPRGRAAQAAASAMHQAAQGLRLASQSGAAGHAPASPQDPASPPSEAPSPNPDGTRAGRADPDLADLQAALQARTGRAWGELPGHLRTEILQMSQGRYRDDYARLIQLYFREIASGDPGRGPKP